MAAPGPERRCPRCGTPFVEGQEYCLECGDRLPGGSGLVARLGAGWRKRLGWYPGDWIWPALLALLIAIAAGVASAIWLADDSSSANDTVVATSDTVSTGPTTSTAPEPTVTTTTTTTPTTGTTTKAAPPPPPPKTLVPGPAGKTGWTIVLDSVPAANGRDAAVAEARQALHLGMPQVGVIESARFSSLHPGYFVVFSGVYDTEPAAQSHIIEAHRHGFRGPYPRRITP
jgi:hypothetical protein